MIYQRLLTGLVCLPILLAAIWQGDFWFLAALVVCSTVAIIEFLKMTAINNHRNPTLLSIIWTISFLVIGIYSIDISMFFSLSFVILIVGAFFKRFMGDNFWRQTSHLSDLGYFIFGSHIYRVFFGTCFGAKEFRLR